MEANKEIREELERLKQEWQEKIADLEEYKAKYQELIDELLSAKQSMLDINNY